jgi:hypothetical protein
MADKALDQKANGVEAGPVRMHRRRAEVRASYRRRAIPTWGLEPPISGDADARPHLRRGLSALATTAAIAQVERLPMTSRAERQIIDNNRALDLQQQQRSFTQQNQFEINSLRNQLQQQQMFPPARTCAPGAVC